MENVFFVVGFHLAYAIMKELSKNKRPQITSARMKNAFVYDFLF